MISCHKCKRAIEDGAEREVNDEILCDDCYIDRIWSKVRKAYYENDPAEFMRRLQESYSVRPQLYHLNVAWKTPKSPYLPLIARISKGRLW